MNPESLGQTPEHDVLSISPDEFRAMALRDREGTRLLVRHALLRINNILDEMPQRFSEATAAEMQATRADLKSRADELAALARTLEH